MNSQTMPAAVSDESVLENLEAEFLDTPSPWPFPPEIDLAEVLAPAIGPAYVDLAYYKTTKVKSRYGGCCG